MLFAEINHRVLNELSRRGVLQCEIDSLLVDCRGAAIPVALTVDEGDYLLNKNNPEFSGLIYPDDPLRLMALTIANIRKAFHRSAQRAHDVEVLMPEPWQHFETANL